MKAIFRVGNENDARWELELDKSGVRVAQTGKGVNVSWPAEYTYDSGRVRTTTRLLLVATTIQEDVLRGGNLPDILESLCIAYD